MGKREADLKSRLTAELKSRAPQLVTLLFTTAGAPDRMYLGNGTASLWEFKHGTPRFASQGIQELTCMRIADQNIYCRYVLWLENARGSNKRTLIVHPRQVHEKTYEPEAEWFEHDIKTLAVYILKVHGL